MFLALLSVICAAPKPVVPRQALPARPVAHLKTSPNIDGDFTDAFPASDVLRGAKPKSTNVTQNQLRVATSASGLYLATAFEVNQESADDTVLVTVYFSGSGVLSKGQVYRFDRLGKPVRNAEDDPGRIGQPPATAASTQSSSKLNFEAQIPVRAWPRFTAVGALLVSVCVEYGSKVDNVSTGNCTSGEMLHGPWQFSEDVRRGLKLAVVPGVEGLEARDGGYVGFGTLQLPMWAQADHPLTLESLRQLIAPGEALTPAAVGLTVAEKWTLPDGRAALGILTGRNPFQNERCVKGDEVRFALYAIEKAVAKRVLEWPVSNCLLGRALAFEVGEEGQLSVGYTNGATIHFGWVKDKYERSELGRRGEAVQGVLLSNAP